MVTDPTLRELRADFGRSRFMAMPIAGTIAWAVAGVLGAKLRVGPASITLFVCTGMIFPLGILIGRFLGEDVLKTRNELDRLFGLNVLATKMFTRSYSEMPTGGAQVAKNLLRAGRLLADSSATLRMDYHNEIAHLRRNWRDRASVG